MKKLLIPLILCAALITGCSGTPAVTAQDNTVTLNEINTSMEFQDGWKVYTGDAVYEQMTGYFEENMKEAINAMGLDYLVYAQSDNLGIMVTVSVQDMTVDASEDVTLTAEEYARSVHDTTVFSYQANGYKIQNSGFSEENYGGNAGHLSRFEALSTDEDQEFVMGMMEYMFEKGTDMYSIQIVYSNGDDRDEALSVLEKMSEVQK